MDPTGGLDRAAIANVTLQQLSELLKADLKAFAFVRKWDRLPRSHGLPANKGKGPAALVDGANTLIRVAFDLRESPVLLQEIPLVEVASDTRPARAVPMVTTVHERGNTSHLRFNVPNDFVRLVKKSFDPFDVTVLSRDGIDLDLASIQTRSNLLHDILQID